MLKRLNLGSGSKPIPGCDNVDSDLDCKAELHFDLRGVFPLEEASYDEVYLFHCIEHIEKRYHIALLLNIWRVLKPGGLFIIAYPEFGTIIKYWQENYRGMRDFWEKTIYGRQAYPGDYHVAAIDSDYIKQLLYDCGFFECVFKEEPNQQQFNTFVTCRKTTLSPSYEKLLFEEIFSTK